MSGWVNEAYSSGGECGECVVGNIDHRTWLALVVLEDMREALQALLLSVPVRVRHSLTATPAPSHMVTVRVGKRE